MKNNNFLDKFIFSIGSILGGFIYIIYNLINRKKKTIFPIQSNNDIDLIYNGQSTIQKNACKIIILLVISTYLRISTSILENYSEEKLDEIFIENLYIYIFIPLFSYLFMNEGIFKHHKLSIIGAIIGEIFILIPIFGKIFQEKKQYLYLNIYGPFIAALYSLYIVIIEFVTKKYSVSPYVILLFFGIFSLILTFIIFYIFSYIKYNNSSYIYKSFTLDENKDYFILIINIIISSIDGICFFLSLYYFSSSLLFITFIFYNILCWLFINQKNNYSLFEIIFIILGYFISIISALIYNEIIILNFYGFNAYTKKLINNRSNFDKKLIEISNYYNDTILDNISEIE